jgi:xanthine dehydrogenase accessory factor
VKELAAIVHELATDTAGGAVLATLVAAEGSSYRRPGARLLLTADGRRIGSISGGCLEEDVLARARGVAKSGLAEVVTYDTTSENDLVWGVGLGCHGIVHVLLEKLPARPLWATTLSLRLMSRQPTKLVVDWKSPEPSLQGTRLTSGTAADRDTFQQTIHAPDALFVFGAGDDARPLVRLAKELGWWVTVADPRAAFATDERFPEADRVVSGPADTLVRDLNPEKGSLAVVMTHHYVHDLPILRALLPRPLAYVGLLGPKKRALRILDDLRAGGLETTLEQRDRLHAPVGLDLGAETPEEVALAIIAEIQATLTTRDARPLRDRKAPIH